MLIMNFIKQFLACIVLLVFSLSICFSQVHYENTYYENVYYEDIHYENSYYENVHYEDTYYEPISYSGTFIEDIYYGGIDFRSYKITRHTITGKEKTSDFFDDSVPDEYKVNWQKVIAKYAVGTTIIVITGVVAVATGGTVGYIAAGAFVGSLKGASSGAAIGALIEGSLAYFQGKPRAGIYKQMIEGSADGFMWGALTGAVVEGFKSAKELKKGKPILNSLGRIEYVVDEKTGIVYLARGGKPVGTVLNATDKNGNYVFFIKDGKLYDFDGNLVSQKFNKKLLQQTGIISDEETGSFIGYVDSKGTLTVGSDAEKALRKEWGKILDEQFIEGGYGGVELGKTGSGKILRRNFQRYYNKTLPKGSQAHHIVPSNASGGGSAGDGCRKIFEKFGIDINDPHNCCPLPSDKNVAKAINTMCHNGSTRELHGEKIMQSLYEDLSRAKTKEDVFEILAEYRQAMLTNNPFWL